MLCVVSESSVASTYCKEEWSLGSELGKHVVHLRFDKSVAGGPETPAAHVLLDRDHLAESQPEQAKDGEQSVRKQCLLVLSLSVWCRWCS